LGEYVELSFRPWPSSGIVLRDVQLWQWLIDLANERFFFGPMCIPVDFVRWVIIYILREYTSDPSETEKEGWEYKKGKM
jgi:hypothetical protein